MIVWLNGTFGAGKTTTSKELTGLLPEAQVFDSEYVGYMLQHVLDPVAPVYNFQEWPPWRTLVVETARQILGFVGGTLVVPQTVLVETYWQEIRDGLAQARIPVRHFVLHSDRDTLTHRIETDSIETKARQWRLDHLARYEAAQPWLHREAEVIDTTSLSPAQVARRIADGVTTGVATRP